MVSYELTSFHTLLTGLDIHMDTPLYIQVENNNDKADDDKNDDEKTDDKDKNSKITIRLFSTHLFQAYIEQGILYITGMEYDPSLPTRRTIYEDKCLTMIENKDVNQIVIAPLKETEEEIKRNERIKAYQMKIATQIMKDYSCHWTIQSSQLPSFSCVALNGKCNLLFPQINLLNQLYLNLFITGSCSLTFSSFTPNTSIFYRCNMNIYGTSQINLNGTNFNYLKCITNHGSSTIYNFIVRKEIQLLINENNIDTVKDVFHENIGNVNSSFYPIISGYVTKQQIITNVLQHILNTLGSMNDDIKNNIIKNIKLIVIPKYKKNNQKNKKTKMVKTVTMNQQQLQPPSQEQSPPPPPALPHPPSQPLPAPLPQTSSSSLLSQSEETQNHHHQLQQSQQAKQQPEEEFQQKHPQQQQTNLQIFRDLLNKNLLSNALISNLLSSKIIPIPTKPSTKTSTKPTTSHPIDFTCKEQKCQDLYHGLHSFTSSLDEFHDHQILHCGTSGCHNVISQGMVKICDNEQCYQPICITCYQKSIIPEFLKTKMNDSRCILCPKCRLDEVLIIQEELIVAKQSHKEKCEQEIQQIRMKHKKEKQYFKNYKESLLEFRLQLRIKKTM